MKTRLPDEALDQLFRGARTYNAWLDKPVNDDNLRQIYDLMKWGPTSANGSPARFLFVRSLEAKERLRAILSPGNVEKTMAAPVTVIVAYDLLFYEKLPRLFPSSQVMSNQTSFVTWATVTPRSCTRVRRDWNLMRYVRSYSRSMAMSCESCSVECHTQMSVVLPTELVCILLSGGIAAPQTIHLNSTKGESCQIRKETNRSRVGS